MVCERAGFSVLWQALGRISSVVCQSVQEKKVSHFAIVFIIEYQCFSSIDRLLLLWIVCLSNLPIRLLIFLLILRVLYIENITVFYSQNKIHTCPYFFLKDAEEVSYEEEEVIFIFVAKRSHLDSFIFSLFHNSFLQHEFILFYVVKSISIISLFLLSRVKRFPFPERVK